jgi:hypothetical protein
MSKGIFINAARRTVSLFDYTDREGTGAQLHRLLCAGGIGFIRTDMRWKTGDVCWVAEKPLVGGFRLDSYPIAGNGAIVGPARCNEAGKCVGHDDTTLSVEQVCGMLQFDACASPETDPLMGSDGPIVDGQHRLAALKALLS